MLWSGSGVPSKGWLRRFRHRHPHVVNRHSQGLKVARARALNPTTVATLYANLEFLYSSYKYPPAHIWNCDESGVQAGRSGGATVLAKRGRRSIHSIEPNQREHLSVLSCVNADGGSIPNFYILKGLYFLEDYIVQYEPGAVMDMQHNALMTRWLFESWISHFLEYLKVGLCIDYSNRHLLILDGHNSHVTLEVVKISMQSGLDIVSLPSHTSHALQSLDVTCFKPFKTAFRRCRNLWSLENSKKEVGKQDLCEWTSRALKAVLTPNNIRARFRSTGIWPLYRTAVKDKMHAAAGFEADCEASGAGHGGCGVNEPAGHPGVATGDGDQPAGHRGRATGLAGTRDKAPDRVDVGPASIGTESNSADEPPQTETES